MRDRPLVVLAVLDAFPHGRLDEDTAPTLAALARVLLRRGDYGAASRTVDHALVLAPSNRELLRLRERTASARCD